MKRIFFLLLMIVSCFQAEIKAQQKYMSKKIDKNLQLLATNCNKKIDVCTKTLYLFTTKHEFGYLTMAKGDGLYYFMLQYIALPHSGDLSGSIHLLLSNGEKLNLNICGKKLDRQSGDNQITMLNPDIKSPIGINSTQPVITIKTGSNPITYCLYEISREDLQKLTEMEMETIIIDYNLGTLIYDTQIGKRKYHKIAVNNILNN